MKNTTCRTARFSLPLRARISRPRNVPAPLASPDLLVMAEAAKAGVFICGLDIASGSGRNGTTFGEIRSRRRRACFAAKAIRANWLWGRCWSNGCLGGGAMANSEVKETGMGNRRKLGAVQGRFFRPRALGGAGSCPCFCVACGSKQVAASPTSRIPRQPVTFAWVFSIQGGMKDMLPGNWLREAALHRWATVPWLLPLSTPWSLETALRGSVSVRTSTTFA